MKKHLAFFDLDKVLYNDHTFFQVVKDEIDNDFISKECWNPIMDELDKYRDGSQEYKVAAHNLLKIWANALKGKKLNKAKLLFKKFLSENSNNFYPWVFDTIEALKPKYNIYIVTSNVRFLAEEVTKVLGVKGYLATEFEVQNGLFTGNILGDISQGKMYVSHIIGKNKEKSLAVGDSENDVGMLEAVEIPVCIHPNKKLEEIAKQKNWKIINDNNAKDFFCSLVS